MADNINQGYNAGSDSVITLISGGQILNASILSGFEAKQMTTRLKSVAMDGVNRYRELEEGWDGDFTFDRGDSIIDDFFTAKEAARLAGQQPPVVTITQTITNPDGSVSKYRYDGVTMKLDSAGSYKGDSKVEQKISWACSRRVKVV